MSWVSEVQDICGDYMIDIKHYKDQKEAITLFFNSSRNAETVKRCLEVDDSVPNVATAVDFVEVVRCKDCKFYEEVEYFSCDSENPTKNVCRLLTRQMQSDDFCSYGKRREAE